MILHPYSVHDSHSRDEHAIAFFRLAFLSALLSPWIAKLITFLVSLAQDHPNSTAPAFVTVPVSATVVYLGLVALTERYLWRRQPFRWALGISTPDISGDWFGVLQLATADGRAIRNDSARVTVQQTWRYFGMQFQTDRTTSWTTSASLAVGAKVARMLYTYHADMRHPGSADPDMRFSPHDGAATMTVPLPFDSAATVEAAYFASDRTVGSVKLTRHQPNVSAADDSTVYANSTAATAAIEGSVRDSKAVCVLTSRGRFLNEGGILDSIRFSEKTGGVRILLPAMPDAGGVDYIAIRNAELAGDPEHKDGALHEQIRHTARGLQSLAEAHGFAVRFVHHPHFARLIITDSDLFLVPYEPHTHGDHSQVYRYSRSTQTYASMKRLFDLLWQGAREQIDGKAKPVAADP